MELQVFQVLKASVSLRLVSISLHHTVPICSAVDGAPGLPGRGGMCHARVDQTIEPYP